MILSDSQKGLSAAGGARMTNVVGEIGFVGDGGDEGWANYFGPGIVLVRSGESTSRRFEGFCVGFCGGQSKHRRGDAYHVAQELKLGVLDRERISPPVGASGWPRRPFPD